MQRLPQRLVIALLSLGALTVSVQSWRAELHARQPIEEAIVAFDLERRRPAEVQVLRFQPAADLRASFLADMTLGDVYRPVSLARLSAEDRGRWLLALTRLDAQLVTARERVLDALARRPGWAFHHASVGEIEYAILRRASVQMAADGSRRWEIPLRAGIAAAPGNLAFPAYLAGAYIETWGGVDPVADPVEVMGLAMKSPAFVARNYRLVGLVLGRTEAMELLPDEPEALRIAFARETRDGEVEAAAGIRARIDEVERIGRARDLDAIRERERLGDVWEQRAKVRQWVAKYRPEALDDAGGRAQVAEVLRLWPSSPAGSWLRDPRASLVRYFLSGRESDVDGALLIETVDRLSDVPDYVRMRVLALGGKAWDADRLARSSGTVGSFEWTPALVALARAQLEEGKLDAAAETVGRIAPAARDECNVLLVRRELGDADAAARLEEQTGRAIAAGRGEGLTLCIDPTTQANRRLVVSVSSADGSLVSWGWDGGRLGSRVVRGESEIEVSLSGRAGRHPFRIETEVGSPAVITNARIE